MVDGVKNYRLQAASKANTKWKHANREETAYLQEKGFIKVHYGGLPSIVKLHVYFVKFLPDGW